MNPAKTSLQCWATKGVTSKTEFLLALLNAPTKFLCVPHSNKYFFPILFFKEYKIFFFNEFIRI